MGLIWIENVALMEGMNALAGRLYLQPPVHDLAILSLGPDRQSPSP